MTRLVCLEPADPGDAWQPYTGARPLAELRAGAWRIRERWAGILALEETLILGDHVAHFSDVDSAPVEPRGPVAGPAVVARSDFAPSGPQLELDPAVRRLTHEDATVAWLVPAGQTWEGEDDSGAALAIEGMVLKGAWDLITALEHLLPADCTDALAAGPEAVPDGSLVLGDPGDVACFGAWVEPGVIFDVRQGPVVLEEGVQVRSGTRLEGPLFVGPGSLLLGGAIRHSAIGPQCRVHGEVAASVFTGYANKSHDGFVGHSVIGHWANLGAGTITSNLKNTYGEVRLQLPGGRVATGRTNLGTLFGDHVKTAIGSLLSTGTVLGTGASVLGAPLPRWIPPFTWGSDGTTRLDAEGFLKIAKRVMPRRQIEVGAAEEASLRALHARLTR
jgi:UDP-N-acetylglucosamine diphosphorylase/glucosamine-1-phosphate N-acetyltransferase